LKNIVFFYEGAEQECSGYIFVLGVRNARATVVGEQRQLNTDD
jgi:hypothetical protein